MPEFLMTAYTGSVSEIASTGTSVLTVTANPATSSPPSCTVASITYSILPVTVTQFRIESNGVIRTAQELDYEMHHLYTFSVAANDGCGEGTASISISVLNADDSAPACAFNVYYFSISENLPPFNTTYSLQCIDPDSLASSILYSISSGNDIGLFDISGGYLSTLSQLDYESESQHNLTVNVNKPSVAITEVTVIVTVLPSNEFPPVFPSELQLVYNVSESSLIGTSIANITAIDEDDGYDGDLTYSFLTSPDHFIIDPVHGNLMVLRSLDREAQGMYTLTIIARDNPLYNGTQRSSDVTIIINVLDANDNVPIFSRDLYMVSVVENTDNIVLVSLHCSDADLDTNADIAYQIISGDDRDQFIIDPSSGNLSVFNSLDYESQQFYNLKVMCSDRGTPSLSSVATIVIEILSANEFAPILSSGGFYTIAEDRQVGEIITTISATDRDSGSAGVLVYSLDQANGTAALRCPPELFQIDPSSGSLYLVSSLDKEAELPFIPPAEYTYECRLIVSNLQPGPESISRLRLRVDNANDIAPVCEPTLNVAEIFEDLSVGSHVTVFACHDGDSLGLSYTITDTHSSVPFSVTHNSTHGIVQLSSPLDYETRTNYSFEIIVSDDGSPVLSTTVMLHVNVKNVNEYPPVFPAQSDSVSVPEDTIVGTVLYTFSTNDDDDSNDSPCYTIIEGDDADLVVLDKLTGVLYLASSLDRETMDFFNITVQADDRDSVNPLTSLMQLNVSISDINDQEPLFSSAISFTSLDEDVMVGSVFSTPICMDFDTGVNSALSCHIITACSYSTSDNLCIPTSVALLPFSFNFSIGEASLLSSLDYETAVMYELEATCGDQGTPGLSSTAILLVEILPANEFGPEFDPQMYSVSITENVSIGESVLRATASDADGGLDGELLYSLTEDFSHFTIDPKTGWLIVIDHLDREQEATYGLHVVATDGSLSAQASIEIIVADVNDNVPFCSQAMYSVRIPELMPTGSAVAQLDCTDADEDDSLQYTILSGNTESVFSVYGNGSIVLSTSVHMEGVDSYHLIVSVTDSSPLPHSIMVECFIYISRSNQPPAFNSSSSVSVSIPISTTVGSFLQTVSAFDEEGDKVYYSLNPSLSFIAIDNFTGGLFLIRSLFRDHVGQHRFVIVISDLELNSSLDLTVFVVDDIEYMLMFEHSLYFVSVAEDEAENTHLLSLQCTNKYGEPVENTHYRIPIAGQRDIFHVEELTGNVLLHGSLDFESANHHNITVECSGLIGQSTATVIVTVLPVNEHIPLFDPDTIEVDITEDSHIGHVITQVTAVDQDHNSHLMYHLEEDFGLFHLDPLTGILYLKHSLDYEFQSVYNLIVVVSDEALMVHSSTGNVVINVVDFNDNNPVCSLSYVTKVIYDDFNIGDIVVSLNCSDNDTGNNSQLVFSMVHNNSDFFSVHQTTGDITVAHRLLSSISSCFLTILVSDKGTPSLSTSVFVELSIVENTSTSDNSLSTTSPTNEITSLNVERFSNSINITIADMTLEQVSLVCCTNNICIKIYSGIQLQKVSSWLLLLNLLLTFVPSIPWLVHWTHPV